MKRAKTRNAPVNPIEGWEDSEPRMKQALPPRLASDAEDPDQVWESISFVPFPNFKAINVYPALPAVLSFAAAMAISVLYSTEEAEYRSRCRELDKDYLRFYLGGAIICWLILPLGTPGYYALGYAYIFFEVFEFFSKAAVALAFYFLYFLGTLSYNSFGLYWLIESSCRSTHYGTITWASVMAYFGVLVFLLLSVGITVLADATDYGRHRRQMLRRMERRQTRTETVQRIIREDDKDMPSDEIRAQTKHEDGKGESGRVMEEWQNL
eukprot:TRINITY_DN4783_c0_g6_i2.p1 TRINITY_DN4783_c0_g6~~TRINITY_DN4783_c0_g6_i2.p1  ORF type:complete len:267 (-),score=57.87 TRINITY_DN4783_c0_g6_i2:71-871(-)